MTVDEFYEKETKKKWYEYVLRRAYNRRCQEVLILRGLYRSLERRVQAAQRKYEKLKGTVYAPNFQVKMPEIDFSNPEQAKEKMEEQMYYFKDRVVIDMWKEIQEGMKKFEAK